MPSLYETKTDDLVRAHFDADASAGDLHVERQHSDAPEIQRVLERASKRGTGKIGKPDLIIRPQAGGNLLLVIECKADPKDHESKNQDCPETHAVDGALHYAGHLAKDFDVIAIGVSGQSEDALSVTSYRQRKGEKKAQLLVSEHGVVQQLLEFAEYERLLSFEPTNRLEAIKDLMTYSRELHNYMRDNAKLAEAEKPLLVSAALIALQNRAFEGDYDKHSAEDLP